MPSALVCAGRAAIRRSRRGLFAGKIVLFGNSVSEDGGNRFVSCASVATVAVALEQHFRCVCWVSENTVLLKRMSPRCVCCRNRREWKPNVQNKALYSEALDRMVRLKITTSALR